MPPPAATPSQLAFIGTYTQGASRGIYAVRFDSRSGALSHPALAAEMPDPSFLTLAPNRKLLYAVSETTASVRVFAADLGQDTLRPLQPPQPTGGETPCHLVVDPTGRSLVVANYHGGSVATVALQPDGTLGTLNVLPHFGHSVNPVRQTSPHVHSVTLSPDGRFLLVCDLGLDRVFSYRLDAARSLLAPADPPAVATMPGDGPRHFAFGADGRCAYALMEMGSRVATFAYAAATGTLTPIQTLPTLPVDFRGVSTSAEIRVHPSGRFVYASNRGHDSIAVFAVDAGSGRLSPVEIALCGGRTPRNFALSPDGNWLLCANQESDSLTVLRVEPKTGRLTLTHQTAECHRGLRVVRIMTACHHAHARFVVTRRTKSQGRFHPRRR